MAIRDFVRTILDQRDALCGAVVDWVTELSYEKTTRIGAEWLGATVAFMEREPLGALVADGTKVPAGYRPQGEKVNLAFQVRGRRMC